MGAAARRQAPAHIRRRQAAVACVALLAIAAAAGACSSRGPSAKASVPRTKASVPRTAASPKAATGRVTSGKPVTLAFAGDVTFEGANARRLVADPASAIGPMSRTLRDADLAMVNLETAITTRGTAAAKTYTFRAPPSAFDALSAAGVDVATMANNHGADFGQVGVRDSLAAARAARFPLVGIGLDDTGAYAPYRTTVNGQRIAIIGATQVLDDNLVSAWTAGPHKPGLASAKQEERLLEAVRDARSGSDTLVVDLHWGKELQSCPLATQRSMARKLVDAGADVVIGSHAHVLLGGGWSNGAYLDYGLGNFVFNASPGRPTAQTGVLTLTTRGRAVTAARWTPGVISNGQPQPLSGSSADVALSRWKELRGCTGLSATPPGK